MRPPEYLADVLAVSGVSWARVHEFTPRPEKERDPVGMERGGIFPLVRRRA